MCQKKLKLLKIVEFMVFSYKYARINCRALVNSPNNLNKTGKCTFME